MWAIINQSGKLTQTQMHEPKWTSDWNGCETGYVVWFAWVTSLLISLLPFILMIIAKKVSFMKTTFFFLKHCFMLSWNLPCALFFPAAKSRAAFLPAASAVHKTHIGALTCGEWGPWPPSICTGEPSWVPHPPLGGFCVLHVLADSEKTRWWIRKRSKPRVYWNRC